MSLLHCAHCKQTISATHKKCPHCGENISFWGNVKAGIENNGYYQIIFALSLIFFMGCAWYFRALTGSRWTLFVMMFLCAHFVPWLLKLAYKNAAPEDTEHAEQVESKKTDYGHKAQEK